ncbi:MAG TPA: ABC-2 family transporter protein [Polyangiaceae bacterium]|jgi:ABC-2 type transport system permease protein
MTRRSLFGTARFARALATTSIRSAMALRASFWMQVVFMVLNNFTFLVFWWALLAKVPSIRGWRLADVAVLYGVTAAGFGLAVTFFGGALQLGRTIDDGELDPLLVQPKPTLLYAAGSRSLASGLGDFASGIALLALSGQVSVWRAPLALLAIVTSGLVFIASTTIFQSLTFWLGRSEAFARQLWDATLNFSLYPEPLFGGGLRLLLFTIIPAGFVGYVPANLVRHPSAAGASLAVTAALAYVALAHWVFRRGLKRYASGSRFGVFG